MEVPIDASNPNELSDMRISLVSFNKGNIRFTYGMFNVLKFIKRGEKGGGLVNQAGKKGPSPSSGNAFNSDPPEKYQKNGGTVPFSSY